MKQNTKVIMFFSSREAVTGGELVDLKICQNLRERGVMVESVFLDKAPPFIRKLPLILRMFSTNIWLLFKVLGMKDRELTLFEDMGHHPNLFIFNVIIGMMRRVRIIVYVQFPFPNSPYLGYYSRLFRSRWARTIDRYVMKIFVRKVDKFLMNSEYAKREGVEFGVPPEKMEVVGVPVELINDGRSNRAIKKRDGKDERITLLYVGMGIPRKGLFYLVEAMSRFANARLYLDVVGDTNDDPAYFASVINLIKEKKLEKQVAFHGHVSDKEKIRDFYSRADIFVFPTLHEGFGIPVLEAMAFGLPIIASDVAAVPELIKDGDNGILIPPANSEELAKALKSLAESAPLRKKYGTNASRVFEKKYRQFLPENIGAKVYNACIIAQGRK